MTTRVYRILLVAVCFNQGVLQSDIILSLSQENVPEYTTAILTCSKNNGTPVETRWKNSKLPGEEAACARSRNKCLQAGFLLNNDLYECSCNDDGTYSVHLKRVDRYQQGSIWSCRESYSISNNVVIELLVPVTNALLRASDNGNVSENSLATFTCNTSFSLPPAQIRWYRSNALSTVEIVNNALPSRNEHIKREEYVRGDNVISVEETLDYRVNRSIHGWNVYCNATNSNNNSVMSNTISLFVLFPPDRPPVIHDFTNGSIYKVIENEPASLSCSVQGGNPLGKPEWSCQELLNFSLKETIKDNKTVITNLTWTAKRNQGKACICRTEHALSTKFVYVDIDVLCKPMANSSVQEDIRSELYVPVTLKVSTIAYPEPQFTWELWNMSSWQPIHNDNMYYISSSGMQSKLRVNNFTSKELNVFHVIVKNFVGTLTHNYTLQPYDVPNQPTELNHIPDLLTDTSITLTWKPGFNGGTSQNFSIGYKSMNFHDWDTLIVQDTGDAVMNLTLKELNSSTYYVFEIFAMNIKGSSDKLVLRLQTKAVKSTAVKELPIGVVVGSISSVIAITFGIVFGMILYRKRLQKKNRGTANAGRSIDEVSEMNTIADEDTSYKADYEQKRPEQDRGVIEIMEQTYEPLRPDKERETSGQTEKFRKEFDADKGGIDCTSPIYTNLILQLRT